jgi:protein-tyrosine phosphatase
VPRIRRSRPSAAPTASKASDTTGAAARQPIDVSSTVIQPSYRSTPWDAAESRPGEATRTAARVLFVSQSGVCRAPLAAAAFSALVIDRGLQDLLQADAAASGEFNVGDPAHPTAVSAAAAAGITIPPSYRARQFSEADIAEADLILVMDKFTAEDVMREATIYEMIRPRTLYTRKIRRLGEFHPTLGANDAAAQDLEDPVYGKVTGQSREEAAREVAAAVTAACVGLMNSLGDVLAGGGGDIGTMKAMKIGNEGDSESAKGTPRDVVAAAVGRMKDMDWVAPPLLRGRDTRPDY